MTALLDASDSLHGYEIMQVTGIKPGTLYPMLARLADQALLESQWQEAPVDGHPPRHMYRLTDSGRALATDLARDDRGRPQPALRAKPT
ncbi:PadR family transcriptional regulator [Parasphingorhabdus sp.]|uniref:PadR family transcriptional regulator n=1 Tax=Parasphingorhabdus sp. TaxID=2709688 RepID=UPI00300152AF